MAYVEKEADESLKCSWNEQTRERYRAWKEYVLHQWKSA